MDSQRAHRQEVLNVTLARLLARRGVVVAPEAILSAPAGRRRMPDVLVEYRGLRVVFEGEFGESPTAWDRAWEAALKRVKEGLAHMGVAVVYPPSLRRHPFPRIEQVLETSELDVAVATETTVHPQWQKSTVGDLEAHLRRAYDLLTQEDIIQQAVAALEAGIARFALEMLTTPGALGRCAQVLGLDMPKKGEEYLEVAQVTGLVLANALVFHDFLARYTTDLKPLRDLREALWDEFIAQWRQIVKRVNYYPIFNLAADLLRKMNDTPWTLRGWAALLDAAEEVTRADAALRHDLMGRIYHRLLAKAKYLGTFYTSIPAAVVLLKLALRPWAWPLEWTDLKALEDFHVADFACGTGTLLMAAADALTDNHIDACVQEGNPPQIDELQRVLAEYVLWGYDVLPSAIHLTASTLCLRAPQVAIRGLNLFSLPLGGPEERLGSLEFLEGGVQYTLALTPSQQVTPQQEAALTHAPLPREGRFHLCVMNPPFTRSVGGNLLFGSLPAEERKRLQRRLRQILQRLDGQANITAGLGAVFVALGDKFLHPGGRMALVLPKALLSGAAWAKTRKLFQERYDLEYLVVSHEPDHWNFSENTNLSEVLVVARLREPDAPPSRTPVRIVNLWHNPDTVFEALGVVAEALRVEQEALPHHEGKNEVAFYSLQPGRYKVGELVFWPWNHAYPLGLQRLPIWMYPAAFAQREMIQSLFWLLQGRLYLPGQPLQDWPVPMTTLGELASLGPDVRDIHDGFRVIESPSAFPAFWGHEAPEVTMMCARPNAYLEPLSRPRPGRPLRKVEDLWAKRARLMLVERMWLKTQALSAVLLTREALSNVWWPCQINVDDARRSLVEKAMVLWWNSTPGLLLLIGHREETRGPWVKFKKPLLRLLPIPDWRELSRETLHALAQAFDRLCDRPLRPLPYMHEDEVRAEIDRALQQALGLPDLTPWRELLAREPIVSLQSL